MTLSGWFYQLRNCISTRNFRFCRRGLGPSQDMYLGPSGSILAAPNPGIGAKTWFDPDRAQKRLENENSCYSRNTDPIPTNFGYVVRHQKALLWALHMVFQFLVFFWRKHEKTGFLWGARFSPLCVGAIIFFQNFFSWGKFMIFVTIEANLGIGKPRLFALGQFLGFFWFPAKSQDWARKWAHLATEFHFLRSGTQDNSSKETARLEILKIGHGFGQKTGFPGVLYLPTEIWGPPIWISLRVLPWPKPPLAKTKIPGRNTV